MLGNLYQSPGYWGCGVAIFMVIKRLPEQMLEIKLLNKPRYYDNSLRKYGYAHINKISLNDCIIITDKYDIAEIVKMMIVT